MSYPITSVDPENVYPEDEKVMGAFQKVQESAEKLQKLLDEPVPKFPWDIQCLECGGWGFNHVGGCVKTE